MTTRRASDRDPALDAKPEPAPKADPSILAEGRPGDWVRVKHPTTGDHYSTTRVLAYREGATLIPDHDALDKYGRPLPRKINTARKES